MNNFFSVDIIEKVNYSEWMWILSILVIIEGEASLRYSNVNHVYKVRKIVFKIRFVPKQLIRGTMMAETIFYSNDSSVIYLTNYLIALSTKQFEHTFSWSSRSFSAYHSPIKRRAVFVKHSFAIKLVQMFVAWAIHLCIHTERKTGVILT